MHPKVDIPINLKIKFQEETPGKKFVIKGYI